MVVKFGLVVSWLSRVSAWLGELNMAWTSGSGRRGGCPKIGGGAVRAMRAASRDVVRTE